MRVIELVDHLILLVVIKWFAMKNKHLQLTGIIFFVCWILIISISVELRYGTLSKWLRYSYDGVRQLDSLDYSIVTIDTRSLYTHILVNFTRLATKTIDHLLNDVSDFKWNRLWLSFLFFRLCKDTDKN
jgi:hypothetical protein